jgi:CheY-like chemotaxis protein
MIRENKTVMPLVGKRIFNIEDDVKNRSVVKTILEYAGALVASESWGRIEIVFARLEIFLPVDLILLDLMFPKNVSGYSVFDALHSNPLFAKIPVIAISASDPEIEVPKVRERGFNGFIAKPIDLHSFPNQIQAILNQEQFWYIA